MIDFALDETPVVLTVDLESYGSDEGEMSTIFVAIDGTQIDRWPKLGPWHRSEIHGAKIVGLAT